MFLSPKIGYAWVSALDDASKEKYDAALEKLNKIEPHMGNDPEFNLLKGFLCFATNNDTGVNSYLNKAIDIVETSQKYSDNEKRYLTCYANVWIAKSSQKGNDKLSVNVDSKICDFSNILLSDVSKALKENFPLRQHPDWRNEEVK